MKEITWSDEMKTRSRTPRLWVNNGSGWSRFDGSTIPGVVVAGQKYVKNGKWSNTTYRLAIGDSVRLVQICQPFEGWGSSWDDLAQGCEVVAGVELKSQEVKDLLRASAAFNTLHAQLVAAADDAEAALAALASAESDADPSGEFVIVSKHAATIEWLRQNSITGKVIEFARADDVRGRQCIGALPLHLAALAARVGVVTVPGSLPQTASADEMAAAGAAIRWYTVQAAK